MSLDPQPGSRFISRLPREVRDAVYFELWRSCGLRQHIIWHQDKHDRDRSHFCRWECTTPFTVEDKLQDDIELIRVRLGTPEGECFADKTHALRLFSAWKNHWACGQRIGEVYGDDMDPGVSLSSSRGPCWSNRNIDVDTGVPIVESPYLSMLLSCKAISSECLKSIYESTTFVFTDTFALNMFVGFCKVPLANSVRAKMGVPPPAFRTYGQHLELSLNPVFSTELSCSSPMITPVEQERHCSLDFHGLRLDLLENLTTVDIWVAARCTHLIIDRDGENLDPKPYDITKLSLGQLKQALSHFGLEKNITISTPLTERVEPEDGYIEHDEQYPRLRIWRRGAGDLYHPVSYPIISKESLGSNNFEHINRHYSN
ncbi:hypothetical protein BKA59DRAFT_487593 [Fusarium tricinctum]|uniref:Uncharacterized protein n=1 Tax=Fusarium tricinctum TaxID=61284 RepID=A0A8K0RMV0_9HYPO|nr:hypothetical protein BKA59DRAFT_487593 [Fusarium tricinctum]